MLPKSALGKACDYLLSQWEPLVSHLHYGETRLDNNLMENAIRPSAIGKNYAECSVMRSKTSHGSARACGTSHNHTASRKVRSRGYSRRRIVGADWGASRA